MTEPSGLEYCVRDRDGRIVVARALPKSTDPARLRDALDYAVAIIENYQLDIRAPYPPGSATGRSLADDGFCQGTIYQDAIHDILVRAGDIERVPSADAVSSEQ